jgi:hypothetical protein
MKNEIQIIKLHHAVKAPREIVEQISQVAMSGDSLCNFEQHLIRRGWRLWRVAMHPSRIASRL